MVGQEKAGPPGGCRGSRVDAVIKVGSLAELLALLLGVQMASGHITESQR